MIARASGLRGGEHECSAMDAEAFVRAYNGMQMGAAFVGASSDAPIFGKGSTWLRPSS
jgi:hypothetical protein